MNNNKLIIYSNNKNIAKRVIYILCFLILEFLIVNHIIINKQGTKGILLLSFLSILLLCILFPLLMSLFRINKVKVDLDSKIILFKQLLNKRKYAIHNIIGFYDTIYKSRRRLYIGIILKLDNNTVIELAGQNLNNLRELHDYLISNNIPFLGDKKSFFPFRRPSEN